MSFREDNRPYSGAPVGGTRLEPCDTRQPAPFPWIGLFVGVVVSAFVLIMIGRLMP